MTHIRRLDREDMFTAAQFLGDRPQTVLPYHGLVTGRCDAWVAGSFPNPQALLVRTHFVPSEPFGFGRDAEALCDLLLSIDGWTSINVGDALLATMPEALQRRTGRGVTRYGDLYNVMVQEGARFDHPNVGMLDVTNAARLAAAGHPVAPANEKLIDLILAEGLCAAAIVEDRVVARAYAYAATPAYADLSVATTPTHRGQGLATACAWLLIDRLRQHKLTPVWSTGQDNHPSQHIAAKLGFVATSPRVYLRLK